MNSNSSTRSRRGGERKNSFLCVFASLRFIVVGLAGNVYAQADSTPLVTWEDMLPSRGGAVLWVRNPTADTIWIDSLHVEKCLNIRRGGCGSRPLGIALPPGSSKQIHRLEPAVRQDAFSYQWFLDWKTAMMDSTRPLPKKTRQDSSGVIRT